MLRRIKDIYLCILVTLIGSQCLQFNVLNSGNVYQFSSPENTGGDGVSLGTVTCTENGGASLTGSVTYAILQPVSVPFVLNGISGILTLKTGEILDYEQTQQYIFDVSCSYDSDSSTSATTSVMFLVTPVNEFKPVFSDVSLQVSVTELTPIGMVLVARDSSGTRHYTVSDEDSGPDGELRFLPSSTNPPELDQDFSLSMNGTLTLNQIIELDTGVTPVKRVTYQIRVCDGDRVETDCPSLDVVLLIRSENDNPPMFEQDEYTVTVSEATSIGTSLITVVCTDADRNGIGEIGGITIEQPNPAVYIPESDDGNGTVTVFLSERFDYENVSVATATLVCQDTGSLIDMAVLNINVEAVNDIPPQFSQPEYKFRVNRLSLTGYEIGQVVATDSDKKFGNDILYRLIDNGLRKFILKSDGTLVLDSFAFLIEGSTFDLTVEASDGVFNTTVEVFITMTGLLSIPEIVIVGISGILFCIIVILVFVYCCRSKRRSKMVRLDRMPTNSSSLPNPPNIEMSSQRLNSLNRVGLTQIETFNDNQRYINRELPENWKASNIIINELGHSTLPIASSQGDAIYSEVKPKIQESNYVELGSSQFGSTYFESSAVEIPMVPEAIPEEYSDIESVYDDPFIDSMAISCPSLPSMHPASASCSQRMYIINKDLDWGTIPESQLKKTRSVAGKMRRM